MFKRKVYDELQYWKNNYSGKYACLLEGARRVGKTTIAEEFAKKEYKSYIKIDFSNVSNDILSIFDDIAKLDNFFLRLQVLTGINLFENKSVIIFDEIQLFPKARQAIKHLVADGRYHYIETGSLISIKKNVKNILIPSEEHKINIYPMDYEEFLWAIGKNSTTLENAYINNVKLGNQANNSAMRDFRLYMCIGGMPQAIDEYIKTNNLESVDKIKREIINLYKEDLKKIDPSGRLSDIYNSIPSQLSKKKNRFVITTATKKQKTSKDEERLYELIDSKIVLPCYNVSSPSIALNQTRDNNNFKLYLSDIGLFVTMIFDNGNGINSEIYKQLMGDHLNENLGYLYENAIAQIIASKNRDLFYHTWKENNNLRPFKVDFIISDKNKISPIEVKSSSIAKHRSLDRFNEKYSKHINNSYIISQKDLGNDKNIRLIPIYIAPFMINNK